MVIKCTCRNNNQDNIHGVGKRVANITEGVTSQGKVVVRCTVCGTEHIVKK